MQYCLSRDNALRGGQCSIAYHGTMPSGGRASAVLPITGQCPEGGPVQYCVSRDNALRGGQCSIAYHGIMP